jgi:GNAT superfamily N-acetyltransferase
MARPDADLARAFEATWPAAETVRCGGFLVGRGSGAGGRVSSAIAGGVWTQADIDAVCAQHVAWGQRPLFRAWEDEVDLISALTKGGFVMETPTLVMSAPVSSLIDLPLPHVTTFAVWPPMAIQRDIWCAGSITPSRQAVMDRVAAPKTSVLGRIQDRAAGSAFVAIHGSVAMVHAVEVLPRFRRQGLAGWMMRQAAFWAAEQGATRIALAVSRANQVAQATYDHLGFSVTGSYAYYGRD